jgi:hypothetical protein
MAATAQDGMAFIFQGAEGPDFLFRRYFKLLKDNFFAQITSFPVVPHLNGMGSAHRDIEDAQVAEVLPWGERRRLMPAMELGSGIGFA